jgi:hypothetical protein
VGSYRALAAEGDLLAYVREAAGGRFLVALNLGHGAATFGGADLSAGGTVALSTHLDRADEALVPGASIALRPDEGVVVRLP